MKITRNPNSLHLGMIAVLAGLLSSATPAVAEHYEPTSLSTILLSSDAIVFATVASVAPHGSDADLAQVVLQSLDVVTSRWPLDASGGFKISVLSIGMTATDVRPLRHDPVLREGGRYLLFLRGGIWTAAPVISNGTPIYEVRDGVVQCAGGEIYGLGGSSLMCSTRERQFGPPLSEEVLATLLRAAAARARLRMPDIARAEDEAARPLYTDRRGS